MKNKKILYSINYVSGLDAYQAEIKIENKFIAFVDFHDEDKSDNIQLYFHPEFNNENLNFQEFLKVLKEIEQEFEQIKKNQEKKKLSK